jgi:hypothetical protein
MDSRSQSQRRLSRETPRVLKLKDWNGATGHTGPKTQSPLRGPRMPRCMVGSRNTQRQTHRRDGGCGLGRHHASSFGSASSLRQIRVFWGQSPLPVTPDAERETLYVPVLSDQRRYLTY